MSEAQAQGQATPEAQATADTQAKPEAQPEAEKSFTQADLKKIAANEKREGRTSAIKELLEKTGAESEDDLASGYLEYLEIQEAVTSEADKERTRADKSEARAKAAEERYLNTKREFALRDALRDSGANPEYLGTLLRIANLEALEVDKEGTVSGVEEEIERIREEAAPFFGDSQGSRPRINAPQTTGTGVARPNAQTPEEAWANQLLGILGQ